MFKMQYITAIKWNYGCTCNIETMLVLKNPCPELGTLQRMAHKETLQLQT